MKKYIVKLSEEERAELQKGISQGAASARKLMHARILLKADSGVAGPRWSDQAISQALEVGTATVERVRERFVEEGLTAALTRRRPRSPRLRKLDGEQEARLIALVCSPPEEGQECWTLQLLADKLVELHIVESIARVTIRQVLKKTNSSRGSKRSGASRPRAMLSLSVRWRRCSRCTRDPTMSGVPRCVWMR